jgi:flagellar protein FliO/FliZ
MRYLAFLLSLFLTPVTHAVQTVSSAQPSIVPTYQDPFSAQALMQLVLGLVLVVALILVISWLLRRFSGIAPVAKHMRVLSVLPLGAREKAVLVQVGDKQMLLGVAPGRVSHLQSFEEPVVEAKESGKRFAGRLSEAIKKQQEKGCDEQDH